MNRTFKTIFSKARGAMVVTSEAATSTHKKGTKTLIAAAAAALMMGSAGAQTAEEQGPWVTVPEAGEGVSVVTSPVASIAGLQDDAFDKYVYNQEASGKTGFGSLEQKGFN